MQNGDRKIPSEYTVSNEIIHRPTNFLHFQSYSKIEQLFELRGITHWNTFVKEYETQLAETIIMFNHN